MSNRERVLMLINDIPENKLINIVAFNIARIFADFLDGKECTAFSDGVDVYLTDNDRVIPDVMIVCNKGIVKQARSFAITKDRVVNSIRVVSNPV